MRQKETSQPTAARSKASSKASSKTGSKTSSKASSKNSTKANSQASSRAGTRTGSSAASASAGLGNSSANSQAASSQAASSQAASSQSTSMKEDILRFLLKRGTATAGAIAHHLSVTPQGIRRHLKNLESSELIEHQTSQEGIGRPNHVYKLSRRGREHFPDQYDQFALSLLNTVADTMGPEHVSKLLKHQWQNKAKEYREKLGDAPLQERMQTLVQLRQAEGYMAEYYPAETVEEESEKEATEKEGKEAPTAEQSAFVITEYNCAIAHIAESYPTVCGHELAMFAIALPDCSVERTHWLVNGEHQCGYLVKAKSLPTSES